MANITARMVTLRSRPGLMKPTTANGFCVTKSSYLASSSMCCRVGRWVSGFSLRSAIRSSTAHAGRMAISAGSNASRTSGTAALCTASRARNSRDGGAGGFSARARIARAVAERLIDSVARHVDELGQVTPQWGVHLGHQDQAGRDGLAVDIHGLLKQAELGEVQHAHPDEVERAVRHAVACGLGKPLAETGHLLRRDRRPDCQAKLVRHASSPRCGPFM